MVERIGLRIAYDGSQFNGFQRQPGRRTIEGDLLAALRNIGAIENPISANYRCSSRTDAGVSAMGNVVSIDTSFPRKRIQSALNSNLDDIWCTGSAGLSSDFNVRHALSREYWHFMLPDDHNLAQMRECAEKFIGTHDFSRYGKVEGRNPVRTVTEFDIVMDGFLIIFKIRGENFLWNQVRRMVWAIDQVGRGKANPKNISPEEYGLKRIGLAPAENLVLYAVDIGFKFDSQIHGDRSMSYIRDKLVAASVRKEIMRRIFNDLSNRQIE